jgi:hypothetical protein
MLKGIKLFRIFRQNSVVAYSEISLINNYLIVWILKEPAPKSFWYVVSFNVFRGPWCEVFFRVSELTSVKPAGSVSLVDF